MPDLVIKVEGLSKRYRIGQYVGGAYQYRALRDVLTDAMHAPFRRLRARSKRQTVGSNPTADSREPSVDFIWALKDVSFEVRTGEVVGVVGRNGAGKSTLLKLLSRITEPTEGRAEIKGRLGSLLEVGTGFHPELTGRENVYLSGAILGMTKKEINRKFEEIVAFAELEKFIDTPVKRYSSGMWVRLGFAVAAHLEPEILLVDEVLAVGDAAFQKKCLGKMGSVAKEGRTVLFVSHNMGAITYLCQRALLLDAGQLCVNGHTEQVISHYLASNAALDGQRAWSEGIANSEVNELKIWAVRLKNHKGEVTGTLDVRKPFAVEIKYEILKPLPFCRIGILVITANGICVFETYDADRVDYAGRREPGIFITKCKVPGNLLSPGGFILSINAGIRGIKNLAKLENVLSFNMEDTGAVGSHIGGRRQGVIRPKLKWHREAL